MGEFCTAISCMDGRIQLPVNEYLRVRFDAEFVDTITEKGPNLILTLEQDQVMIESILDRTSISMHHHNSKGIAVVGHFDCAGNPSTNDKQIEHIKQSVLYLKEKTKDIEIIGLWVDEKWKVNEIV